jgi:multiple sugar transport system substrate-binding protein
MRHCVGLRALGIAGALAILLTACSTTGAPTGGGAPTGPTATDPGKSFVFASTQFSPVTEQEAMRKKILAAWNGASVEFITDQEPVIIDRITVEAKAGGTGQIGVVGLENGQFGSLVAANYLNDLSKVTTRNADKKINSDMLTLGKFGGSTQLYVPWMQATYFLAANKKALQYLPAGADVNALTYDQLIAWAKNIFDKTGQKRFGWPVGTNGLIHRLMQGYWYPSFTGGLVTTYKSADAVTMWGKIKELWQYSNPQSTTYAFLQEPLQSEEVWIGIDHAARLINVLKAKPDDFIAAPAPAGPKGRYYMSVVIGLGIPKTTPNQSGAENLIDYLLKAETQITTLRENSFFPVTDVQMPADLDRGLKLEAEAVAKQAASKDAKVVPLPVGLGAKGGDFNTAILNTFQRIVVKGEDIQTVLNEQAAIINKVMTDANTKCWGPDGTSSGPCQVK